MYKTIGLLAHVDAGKTTFAEQLLYHTQSINKRGRVDHKNAFLDSHRIEMERGITVFADQGIMSYKNSTYYLIDTPGHVDFSPEMERAIQVMDYAIIIISAVEGVEGHTETVWQLLRKYHVPTFFFINKTDRIGADVEKVLADIQLNMTEDIFDITDSFQQGEMNERLIEFIAERNEELLEQYLNGGYQQDDWINKMKAMIKENKIFLATSGSALHDRGVVDFLEILDLLTITDYLNQQSFSGRVFKIRHDENGVRITFMKALGGTLKVRDELSYRTSERDISEKVTQIRVYNGNKFKIVNQVNAGELFAVTGLSMAAIGDVIGDQGERVDHEIVPILKSKVLFDASLHAKEVLKDFRILDIEDPSLHVTWEESLQEIHIHVMGVIQLEVLEQLVKERFQYHVTFGEPTILYKETIDTTVIGYGHFEPLRHYAEVHLKLEPSERGTDLIFVNACHTDDLTSSYQNLIRQHLYEREHHGILTGSPITDIKVTLLTGRAHNEHTSGGDFREATYRAIRQGLEKTVNILLEPYYDFKIKIDADHIGRVLSDIQNAHGSFDPPHTVGNKVILTGKAPVATFMGYHAELASITQGKGSISLKYGGYQPCHNQGEVIERIGYKKNADFMYTSSSVFCSKGQSYSVEWEQAEGKMHCIK